MTGAASWAQLHRVGNRMNQQLPTYVFDLPGIWYVTSQSWNAANGCPKIQNQMEVEQNKSAFILPLLEFFKKIKIKLEFI